MRSSEDERLVVSSFSMDADGLVKSSFLKKLSPETFEAFIKEIDLKTGGFRSLFVV